MGKANFKKKVRIDDEVYYCLGFAKYLLGPAAVDAVHNAFGVSKPALYKSLTNEVPPSERERKLNPNVARRIKRRRKLVTKILNSKHTVTGDRYTPVKKLHRQRQKVVRKAKTVYAVGKVLFHEHREKVSVSTIRRDVKAEGWVPRKPRKVPRLTADKMLKRVGFAEEWLKNKWPPAFTDEAWLDDNEDGGWVWVRPGEHPTRDTEKYPSKVMIWCLFCPGLRYFSVIEGTVDGEGYVERVLKPALPYLRMANRLGYFIQEDNARVHTAQSAAFYKKHRIKTLPCGWPTGSCDLSLVENIFGIVKPKVRSEYPWGVDQIIDLFRKHFQEIPEETVLRMYEGFPARLRQVIAAKGASIKPKRGVGKKILAAKKAAQQAKK